MGGSGGGGHSDGRVVGRRRRRKPQIELAIVKRIPEAGHPEQRGLSCNGTHLTLVGG